jgi:hypothetical protein
MFTDDNYQPLKQVGFTGLFIMIYDTVKTMIGEGQKVRNLACRASFLHPKLL